MVRTGGAPEDPRSVVLNWFRGPETVGRRSSVGPASSSTEAPAPVDPFVGLTGAAEATAVDAPPAVAPAPALSAAPPPELPYPGVERAADEAAARRDASRGLPDLDYGDPWTLYLASLLAVLGERVAASMCHTLDVRNAARGRRARLVADLRAAQARQNRVSHQYAASAENGPHLAEAATREQRITARRAEGDRRRRIAAADTEISTAESAVAEIQGLLADTLAELDQDPALRLGAQFDLLAAHTTRRMLTYATELCRRRGGWRLTDALAEEIHARVFEYRQHLNLALRALSAIHARDHGADVPSAGPAADPAPDTGDDAPPIERAS